MKSFLSKQSQAVNIIASIGTDMSRLIGQFAGNDLPLQPGDSFYDIEIGGFSHVKMARHFGLYTGIIGKNLHINEWIVKRRTPQSYVVEYVNTAVVCETDFGLTYKYRAHLPGYSDGVRRIFPFRRKLKTTNILKELSERNYVVLLCKSKIRKDNGDFYLTFSEINRE